MRPSMVPNVRWQFVLVYNAPEAWRARALEDVASAVLDGAIRVGAEAGLLLFDPERPWRIDSDHMASRAGNTPFDGLPVQGKVLQTIKGGVVVR